MLDLDGTGKITYEVYEKFWCAFLRMYSNVMGIRIEYDDKMRKITLKVFNIMTNPGDSFNFEDF
jgi:hypothetical protein